MFKLKWSFSERVNLFMYSFVELFREFLVFGVQVYVVFDPVCTKRIMIKITLRRVDILEFPN